MQIQFFVLAAILGCVIATPVFKAVQPAGRDLELRVPQDSSDPPTMLDIPEGSPESEGPDEPVDNPEPVENPPETQEPPDEPTDRPPSQPPSRPSPKFRPPPPKRCGNRRNAVPFFRRNYPSFVKARIIGFFFRRKQPSTVALYVLYNPRSRDYLYTVSVAERAQATRIGYRHVGVAGWVYLNNRCGGVPLYRLYSIKSRQHFYTTSFRDRLTAQRRGYRYQGVAAYLYRV